MTDPLPSRGRLAGIDFGTVRIGIAVTDVDQTLASPYENYTRRDLNADARHFLDFVRDEEIVGVVLGLPIHLSGNESQKSFEVREFAAWLRQTTKLPVALFDERFTTREADMSFAGAGLTRKKKKQRLDMVAAQIILAAFLESSRESNDSLTSLDDERGG